MIAYELVVLLFLAALNGLFSGAEIALLSVRKARLIQLARRGGASARVALRLREQPEQMLATLQVGITVIGVSAGAFGGSTIEEPLAEWLASWGAGRFAEELAFAVVVSSISCLSIVLGELVPKSLALRASEPMSLLAARPLFLLSRVARPLVWLLTAASNLVLRPFRDQTTFTEARLSPQELRQILEEAVVTGSLSEETADVAVRAIDLGSLRVEAIMVPRAKVATFSATSTVEEIWTVLRASPHARYPVVGEELEEVRGYVLARDVVLQLVHEQRADLGAIVRPIPFFPYSKLAIDALREMQERKTPIALVVDEHGGVSGLVTTEDIVEEVFGDLLDEHEARAPKLRRESPHDIVVAGVTSIRDVNRELGTELPEGPGFTTIAGLVLREGGGLVGRGTIVDLPGGVRAEVLSATPRQVGSVRLRVPAG